MKRNHRVFILRTLVAAVALLLAVSVLQFLYEVNYSYIPYDYHLLNWGDYLLETHFLTISAGFALAAVFFSRTKIAPIFLFLIGGFLLFYSIYAFTSCLEFYDNRWWIEVMTFEQEVYVFLYLFLHGSYALLLMGFSLFCGLFWNIGRYLPSSKPRLGQGSNARQSIEKKIPYIKRFFLVVSLLFLLVLLFGAFLLIRDFLIPYHALERIQLPPGSEVVEAANVQVTDVNWDHILGVKAVRCPLPQEEAEAWVQANNRMDPHIDFVKNGGMGSDRDYYYGPTKEGECFLILCYYRR